MPFDATGGQRDRTRGILLMLAAVLLLSLNDVMGKWLVASYVVGQVVVLRSLAALALLTPLAWRALRAAGWRLAVTTQWVVSGNWGALGRWLDSKGSPGWTAASMQWEPQPNNSNGTMRLTFA